MLRPARTFLFALLVLLAVNPAFAKTSATGLQPGDLPCPGNRGESVEAAGGAVTAPSPGNESANPRVTGKALRQRWKALLPGTLKSAT